MKPALSFLAAIVLGLGWSVPAARAQGPSNFDNCLKLENGRLVWLRQGRIQPLDRPVTLSDGTIVALDGYYEKSGGYRTPLAVGETIATDGVVMNITTLPKPRTFRRR